MIETPVIFWEDEQRNIHAICSNQYICFGEISVNQNQIPSEHQFDGSGIDVAAYLPEKIWAFLLSIQDPQKTNTLILDKSLTDAWHKIPWERLNWRGQKLAQFWKIIRLANVIETSNEKAFSVQNTLIWDQWENDDLSVLSEMTRRCKIKQIQKDVDDGIDVGGYRRLVIFAHGGEKDDRLFLDNEKKPWNPELPKTLPPEVFIIACASYHGNFHQFVQQCLARGAKTVICGHGKLDAQSMLDALATFVNEEKPAYEILWELQAKTDDKKLGDVNWLRIYGDAPISEFDFTLFKSFQTNKFEPVFKQFKALGFQTLLEQTQANKNHWQLTQHCLLSCALYLAEKEAHSELESLRQQLKNIPIQSNQLLIESHYSMANAFRRDGKYPLAIDALISVLKQDDIFTNNVEQRVRILRSLLNDLIDLNLVIPAKTIADTIEFLLQNELDCPEENFKFLDQKARLAIRKGCISVAVNFYQKKAHNSADSREFAGILYALSWLGDCQQAKVYAEKIEAELHTEFHNGNDTNAYFLRALAAYKYFDSTAPVLAEEYLAVCQKKLIAHQDSGPFAMTLLYHLLKTNDCEHELWQLATSALEDDAYWFELTAFYALANQNDAAESALNKFHKVRRSVIEKLQMWQLEQIDWLKECIKMEELEKQVFLAPLVKPEDLTKHGLLPL